MTNLTLNFIDNIFLTLLIVSVFLLNNEFFTKSTIQLAGIFYEMIDMSREVSESLGPARSGRLQKKVRHRSDPAPDLKSPVWSTSTSRNGSSPGAEVTEFSPKNLTSRQLQIIN